MIGTIFLALFWRPYFPPSFTIAIGVVLIGLAVWAHACGSTHRPTLGPMTLLLRIILIGLITVLLMGPSGLNPGRQTTGRPVLRILLDSSASMQTPDADGLARYDFARQRWLTPPWIEHLRRDYDVEMFAFDKSLRAIGENALESPGSTGATGDVTNLARAVSDSLVSLNTEGSAVLVLSDGRDTLDAPMHPVGQIARSRSRPVYTVALGGPSMSRDLAVVAVPRQPYLFAEEPGSITVSVMRSNIQQAGTTLHVQQGDHHETYPVEFEGDDNAAIDVPIVHDDPGSYDYRVWVDPVPGEADEANNIQPVFIEVTAKRLRVLLLEGQPYWDTKFLAHALRKDTRIELTQITQVTPDKRETIVSREGASTDPPATLEDLGRFDVVILGRSIGNVLDEELISRLPEYVSQHGGRLVFARGRAYDPDDPADQRIKAALAVIEPVIFGQGVLHNQQIELEPIGMMHPNPQQSRSDDGPTLLNIPVVEREKPGARVLARTHPAGVARSNNQGQPAIVTMPYGRGMVVSILGEGLWRWALRPRRPGQESDAFDSFWMDSVRWLALGSDFQPGKPLSLRLSRLGVQVGDPIQAELISRIGFDKLDPLIIVQAPDGTRTTAELSPVPGSTTRRLAVLHPQTPGVYRVTAHDASMPEQTVEASFNCYHIDIERMHTSANRGAMRNLAEASGGQCLSPDDPDAFPELLKAQRLAMQSPPRPVYVWGKGWVMTLVLFWAGLEWILRRAGGLL